MMKIAIFGATGRVGREFLKLALLSPAIEAITVLVRDREKLKEQLETDQLCGEKLTIIVGNANNQEAIQQTIQSSDAIFSALSTGGTKILTECMTKLLCLSEARQRLIIIGTAGILDASEYPGMLRYQSPESRNRKVTATMEHHQVWDLLKDSNMAWTIICPTALVNNQEQNYRTKRNQLPEDSQAVSFIATAQFAFQQLFAQEDIGYRIGISY